MILENYNPPPATVYRFQWYHGTLDRLESNHILKQYAKNLGGIDEYSQNQENINADTEFNQVSYQLFLFNLPGKVLI